MASRTPMTLRAKQPRVAVQPTWSGRSHVSTFVHCLHLLDLDQLEDWPEITEAIFTSNVAKQNQQNKLKATEWALYRLFERYNAEEARDKLRPFFPPTSPLQSVNLRAALYRCLGELKKNGTLGTQYQLRKTMLDECKGEKFEELISGFAMIVLRKHVDQRIILDHKNLEDDQLLPLVLAHRAVLSSMLGQRKALRKESEDTMAQVEEARDVLTVRRQEVQAQPAKADSVLQRQMATLINTNWIGNHAWATLLLQGLPPKAVFQASSLQPSSRNQKSADTESPVEMLINKLDDNISKHRARLAEWKVIARDLEARRTIENSQASVVRKQATTNLQKPGRFSQHKELSLNTRQERDLPPPEMDWRYKSLLDAMQHELRMNKPDSSEQSKISPEGPSLQQHPDLTMTRSTREDRYAARGPVRTRWSSNNSDPNQITAGTALAEDRRTSSNDLSRSHPPKQLAIDTTPLAHYQTNNFDTSPVLDPSPVSTLPDETSSIPWIPDMNETATKVKATIPFKVSERVPSPATKHNLQGESPASPSKEWMSLMDRTRASMSSYGGQTQSLSVGFEEDDGEAQTEPPETAAAKYKTEGRRVTLVERTRQSMSLLATTNTVSKFNDHNSRRKSQRMSQLFPINQFETPGKPRPRISEFGPSSESSTPREKLFEQEADYESVFKSRPRIAMSPTLSPDRSAVGFDSILEEDLEGLQLASDDEYD